LRRGNIQVFDLLNDEKLRFLRKDCEIRFSASRQFHLSLSRPEDGTNELIFRKILIISNLALMRL